MESSDACFVPQVTRRVAPGAKRSARFARLTPRRTTRRAIRCLEFQRHVRDISRAARPDVRFQSDALRVLHEATEQYFVALFKEAQRYATLKQRAVVTPLELSIARRLSE